MPETPDPIDQAMQAAAKLFGVSAADIRSPRRSRDVHAARTWGIYLACAATDASFEEIGQRFGRDHTIVQAVVRGRAREIAERAASASFFEVLKSGAWHDSQALP
jgi:chromosomal replication initiator protein